MAETNVPTGRQISLVATLEDERVFLDFLRSTAPLQIFESFAPTVPDLWVDHFAPERVGHISYQIWNTAFAWEPSYAQVGPLARDPTHIGWAYVSNTSCAPLLELRRSLPKSPGRLYWARDFAAPDGLGYDVDAFSRWIDRIFGWVRRNGRKKQRSDAFGSYWLPAALRDAGTL